MIKEVRYAIIGCGEHALRSHALPGRHVPGLVCAGAYDPSHESVARFVSDVGSDVRAYASEAALLADATIDAVLIATPDRWHAEQLVRAIEAGKHVLCEKPLAVDDTEQQVHAVRSALIRAQERRLVVTSCHPRRFDPPYVWLRRALGRLTNEFGLVISVGFDFSYHEPSSVKHGSLLLDHVNHEIDAVHFVLGRCAFTAQRVTDGVDRYEVVGERSDGVTFTFRGTRFLKAHRYRETIAVRFAAGDATIDCESGMVTITNHETGATQVVPCGSTDYERRFQAVMENFAQAIRGETAPYLTDEDLLVNTMTGVALTQHGSYQYLGDLRTPA